MNMKKILAGLLAVVMLFAMVPVVAFAAGETLTVNAPIEDEKVLMVAGNPYFITTGDTRPLPEYVAPVIPTATYTTGGTFNMSVDKCLGWNATGLVHWDWSNASGTGVSNWDAYMLGAKGNFTHLGFNAWIYSTSSTQPMTKVGYQFDDGEIIWQNGSDAAVLDWMGQDTKPAILAEEPGTASLLGQPHVRRMTLWIDISGLQDNHSTSMWIYTEDAAGNIYCLNSFMKGDAATPFNVVFGTPATVEVVDCDYTFVNDNANTVYAVENADGTLKNVKNGNTTKFSKATKLNGDVVAVKTADLKPVTKNGDVYEYAFEYTEDMVFTVNDNYYVSTEALSALTPAPETALAAPKVSNENAFYQGVDVYMGVCGWGGLMYHWKEPEVRSWEAFVLGDPGWYNALGWYGWIVPDEDETKMGNVGPMTALGYQFNDSEIVWVDGATEVETFHRGAAAYGGQKTTTVLAEDESTATVLGQPNLRRATLWIDLSSISGTASLNAMYLYAKDGAGNIYCLNNSMTGSATDPFLIEFGVVRYDYADANGNKYEVANDGYTLVAPQSLAETGMELAIMTSDGSAVAVKAASKLEVPAPGGEVVVPVTGAIKSASVTLGADLSITYGALVENNTNTPVMNFQMADKNVDVVGEYNAEKGRWYFKFEGICPQNIADEIVATLYDGATVLAVKDNYCVKDYLLREASYGTAAMKTLVYNALNYGAVAQVYTGYKTDSLMNVGVESLGTSYTVGAAADYGFTAPTNTSATAKINSANLVFSNVNQIKITYSAGTLYMDGVEVTGELNESGRYDFYSDGIVATKLDTVHTFELVEDGEVVSTMTYSAYAWCARTLASSTASANGKLLAQALYDYGMATDAYVAG